MCVPALFFILFFNNYASRMSVGMPLLRDLLATLPLIAMKFE